MISQWIAAHKSLVVSATSTAVIAALVATVAVVSSGYPAQRLELNDAAVWVANGSESYIGRANTEVLALDTVVAGAGAGSGADLAVVQGGSHVFLFERSEAKLDIVDPATSEILEDVALPPDQAEVFIAGDNVVIYSQGTGELWVMAAGSVAQFDTEQEPTLNLGADSVVSVDPYGMLFAFAPKAHEVYRVDAAAGGVVDETASTRLSATSGEFSITSVAGEWAILDGATGQLEFNGALVDLDGEMGRGGGPVLQAPSTTGDRLLVGYSAGLLAVSAQGSSVTSVVTGRSGVAARPMIVEGCEFAGWSGGDAWRHCAGEDASGSLLSVDGMPATATLAFQSNGGRVVLNDTRGGASWAVQRNGELIDNWDDLITVAEDQQEVVQNDEDTPPQTEEDQLPPVAVDDEFGARPGRASKLPVLLNDYDANGDVLVIGSVGDLDENVGRIDLIDEGQALQLTLAPGAAGVIVFDYTITDGRGGTATASVRVTVRAPGENSPPEQARPTKATVESGGQVSLSVLGDWVDPDGDAFYLSAATAPPPDAVSHKPEGTVIFTDSGTGAAEKAVILVVTDGTEEGSGSLTVSVRAQGTVPIIADPFVVLAYAGQEVTIAPLGHVRGGNGIIRLNAIPPKSGSTITPSYETGTFRFTSSEVRTHYLEYVVTDDAQTVTGIIRVDVAAPPGANTSPIAIPKTVFVRTLSSETIDVASSDIDPAGGVLLVTGVMNVPVGSGVRAEVLEQRSVRVTLTGLLSGPVTFNYRLSNGLAETEGTVTVVEIPTPSQFQPPVARDDTATVRVGDAITIDVMANDEHPDGLSIRLNPVLVEGLSGSSGLLFASANVLRYLAPDHPGNFTAVYEIIGPYGQTAQAQVTIEVREPNVDTNHAPVPVSVTSRVLAGEQVKIDIPLDGIDPDGDSVQLLGQETNPEKGAVIEVGSNYILYEAGQYSAGTDTFTYTLIDALGARATGTVRVGISPRLDGARNPVAIEDEVRARPGATVFVQVLTNDSDPDGNTLTVESVEVNDPATTATIIDGSIVSITPPAEVGAYGVVYTIRNSIGGTSSNFITVIVAADAPLAYPIASDTVLTLSDVLDRDTVDVAVLDHVFFADGPVGSLGVAVQSGYGASAEVLGNKRIRVTIGDESQIIPFAVTHPDDSSVKSYAFIWVPGYNDALPQLDRRAPHPTVVSEDTLTIDINDFVLAVGGKKVRLTDSNSVRATHSNGESLVVDSDTITFTSADLYFGPASVSFEVTDGSSATDPNGRKAILVLPITVTPRENQAPVLTGAVIDFEPGQTKVIDLIDLTNYPYLDDLDELAYSIMTPLPQGFSYELTGQILTLRANDDAVKGSTTAITLGVRDAAVDGKAGRIQLQVVPSTRPLAKPASDTAVVKRGQTTVINVLDNDEATNPFPGKALRVVSVVGAAGSSLPAGVTVAVSENNTKLTVTVSNSAEPIDANLQYQVSDATRDPDRYAWGTVRISVQDVPDAPAKPVRQANGFVGGELKLRITPTQENNSPVVGYRVVSTSNGGYSHDCGTALICSLTGLTVGAKYTFQVIATNAIGDSAPSAESDQYSIDYLPAAPVWVTATPSSAAAAPSGGSLDISWQAVPNPRPGTDVTGYTVLVSGQDPILTSSTSVRVGGLAPDMVYQVTVYARNAAQVTSASEWNRTTISAQRTIGLPGAPSPAPQASSDASGNIQVSWGASYANGGNAVAYSVARVDGAASSSACPALSAATPVGSSPWLDTSAADGAVYTYCVYSFNGTYSVVNVTGATESKAASAQAFGSATIVDSGSGQYDIRAGSVSASGYPPEKYQYFLSSDGTWRDIPAGNWLTTLGSPGVTYGEAITVSFRACRDTTGTLCGPASPGTTLTPINTRVVSATCDASPNPAVITAPTNGSAVTGVTYRISYERSIPGVWTPFTYDVSDGVPLDAVAMRVAATVQTALGDYGDPGYGGDFACNH